MSEVPNEEDLQRLLRQWYSPAYRTAFLLVADGGRAEDAVQEAFLRVWRFRDALPTGDALRPWIYRVVVNACYSTARSESRHSRRRSPATTLEEMTSREMRPEEAFEDSERASAVRDAVLALPVSLRVPVVLRYYSGLSESEVASAIHRRPGTVKSRLFEARRQLAQDERLARFTRSAATDEEEEVGR